MKIEFFMFYGFIFMKKKFHWASLFYFHDYIYYINLVRSIFCVYSWFLFHEHICASSLFECRFSCNFYTTWIHLYFIPYLKNFVLVFKVIIKLVSLFFNLVKFSNMLNYFQTLIFENPTFKDGWMGVYALYTLTLKIYLNMCMKKR